MLRGKQEVLPLYKRLTTGVLRVVSLQLLLTSSIPALADEWCVGKDPVPHDDGRYHFTYESWVRARANAFMYGRCIKVLDPTAKLRNFWEGVLPEGIATKERPTTGGQSYIDDVSENGVAKLHYGNSDDSFDASYIRHKSQPNGVTPEKRDATFREKIESAIKSTGSFVLESVYSFSAPLVAGNDESVADIDVLFRSVFDGKTFTYSLSYSKQALSPQYAETGLSVQFKGEEIARLEKLADTQWSLSRGQDELSFQAPAPVADQADFVDHEMALIDHEGRTIATLPISYMLPAEN